MTEYCRQCDMVSHCHSSTAILPYEPIVRPIPWRLILGVRRLNGWMPRSFYVDDATTVSWSSAAMSEWVSRWMHLVVLWVAKNKDTQIHRHSDVGKVYSFKYKLDSVVVLGESPCPRGPVYKSLFTSSSLTTSPCPRTTCPCRWAWSPCPCRCPRTSSPWQNHWNKIN